MRPITASTRNGLVTSWPIPLVRVVGPRSVGFEVIENVGWLYPFLDRSASRRGATPVPTNEAWLT